MTAFFEALVARIQAMVDQENRSQSCAIFEKLLGETPAKSPRRRKTHYWLESFAIRDGIRVYLLFFAQYCKSIFM